MSRKSGRTPVAIVILEIPQATDVVVVVANTTPFSSPGWTLFLMLIDLAHLRITED